MINIFALNVALAVSWAALTGNFTLSGVTVGFGLGALCLYLTRSLYPGCDAYFRRAGKWGKLIVLFLYELVMSSIQVVAEVLRPTPTARPGVFSMPLTVDRELDVLLLTNMISLTPGTLSLDVSDDVSTLYIHAMFADDPEGIRQQIKGGMERWVIEARE